MAKRAANNIKLGIFVMAGMAFLILLLYVIGKNQDLFGKTFILKVRFENVRGLMPGNNIRYSGIDAGTVKRVEVLDDTTIEVTLLVEKKMKPFLHRNSIITIGTDGLMGNKLINIQPAKAPAPLVEEGDVLRSTSLPGPEDMLKVLNSTNNDVATVARELRQAVVRFNSSKGLWAVLNDETIPSNVRLALGRLHSASAKVDNLMGELNEMVDGLKAGKGSLGELIADTAVSFQIRQAVEKIRSVGANADALATKIHGLTDSLGYDINQGNGTVHALLKNEEMANRLMNALRNIEKGTQGFEENMEALKHNFLLRGYFRRLERQKKDSTLL